jgi:hypothetical protein
MSACKTRSGFLRLIDDLDRCVLDNKFSSSLDIQVADRCCNLSSANVLCVN